MYPSCRERGTILASLRGRALAESIDEAAHEGALTGPVAAEELKTILRELENEWAAADLAFSSGHRLRP